MDMIKIRINTAMKGFFPGRTISLEVDKDGVVKDPQWRRIVKDSFIDSCVTILDDGVSTKDAKVSDNKKKLK